MTTTFNQFLKNKDKEIELILDKWGFLEFKPARGKMKSQIQQWLANGKFQDRADEKTFIYEDAFKLLNQIEYLQHDIDSYVESLSIAVKAYLREQKIENNNILVFTLGNSTAEGGATFLHDLKSKLQLTKKALPLSSFNAHNFKDSNINCVIFVDDFIGSGNTVRRSFDQSKELIAKLKEERPQFKVILLSLVGFEDIKNELSSKYKIEYINFQLLLGNKDRIFNVESKFFSEKEEQIRLKKWCKIIGEELYPEGPLGYDDCQTLIVFKDGYVPNNTLPIIWAGPESECTSELSKKWNPLFKRQKEKEPKKYNIQNGRDASENIDSSNLIDTPVIDFINDQFLVPPPEKYLEIDRVYDLIIQDFKWAPPDFIANIESALKENGIVIIIGPILTGKSSLLSYLQRKVQKDKFTWQLDGEKFLIKKDEIVSREDLYHFWFDSIGTELLYKMGKTKNSLDVSMFEKFSSSKKFITWMQDNKYSGSSLIHGFINCLEDFKVHIGFKQDILISFYLEDVHEYINYWVFSQLKDDLRSLGNIEKSRKDKKTVKIVVATRYFPSISIKKKTIRFLPYFDKDSITFLLQLLKQEIPNNLLTDLAALIYKKTDGHPWAVIRFFKIYLRKRIERSSLPPFELAEAIFSEKSYWIYDYIFGQDQNCPYIEKLLSLFSKCSNSAKEDFIKLINLENQATVIDSGYNHSVDFLSYQSGFIKMSHSDNSSIESNGSFIMQTYFKGIIEKDL